jgi:monothiol glutaredoxin
MKIAVYIRSDCNWCRGVCEILDKYALAYEKFDIVADKKNYDEMVRKSGQTHCPCIEIDGVVLGDVSGEEVENYLLAHELIKPALPHGVANDEARVDRYSAYVRQALPTQFF